jgi:uncharacterized membrane protein
MNEARPSQETSVERRDRFVLAATLIALGTLYLICFRDDRFRTLAYAVFATPPLLLGAFVARRAHAARFWSGVLALLWFSHGVMIAWSEPAYRGYALVEIALATAIVFLSSAGGLRARARKRKAARETSA